MSVAALRRLAVLQECVEAETAFGGRSRSWTDIGVVWLALDPPTLREVGREGQRPERVVTTTAQTRDDPRIQVGHRLAQSGDSWRVVHLVRGAPMLGRMTLSLEKDDR